MYPSGSYNWMTHKVCYCNFILVANGLIKFTAHSIVTVSETFSSVIFVCTVSTKLLVPLDVITCHLANIFKQCLLWQRASEE